MSPFSVTVEHVPDRDLGPLLARLSEAGFAKPIISHLGVGGPSGAPVRLGLPDLPEDWRLLQEREGESYRWPKRRDGYAPYRVYMGTTRAEGAVQIGLGETTRENAWGRDRKYVVAFLSGGSPQHPLVEFVAADDFEDTRELVAVVRGSDGGRRMYGVGDTLPAVYAEHFRTQIYNERVVHPGVWNKVVVVAREDDHAAMLNHALIQSRRRYRTSTRSPADPAAATAVPERTRTAIGHYTARAKATSRGAPPGDTPSGDLTDSFLSSDRRAILLSSRWGRNR